MLIESFLTILFATATIEGTANPSAIGAKPKKKAKTTVTQTTAQARPVQTDSLFFFNTGEKDGMRLAHKAIGGDWTDVGQIFSSDYGRWGSEKRMFTPFVKKLSDGTYAAVFSVNDKAPCFAVAYSEDLVTWRPQDYPRMSVKGCLAPVIREDGDGRYTVVFKTKDGHVRKTTTADAFRHFTPDVEATQAEYDAAMPERTYATVDGKKRLGNICATDSQTVVRMKNFFEWSGRKYREALEKLTDDKTRFAHLSNSPVEATVTIDGRKQKKISDRLIGIFFEDISYAADGGLYAEMVQNRDFEYSSLDRREWTAQTAWKSTKGDVRIGQDYPLSENNPHYALIADETLTNEGWDGMAVKAGDDYDFSFFARNIGGKAKTFTVELKDGETVIAQTKIKTKGKDGAWKQYAAKLTPTANADKATLSVTGEKQAEVAIDLVSLFPRKTFCERKNGLRQDLAQTLADLKPKFVRFPGGCMSHGDGLENIYHWQNTIGPLQDRKPDRNSWSYHQTRGLGFYELFQFCEDIGAEPLPVLAAGVPCQNSGNNSDGYGGQQGGIPMDEMPAYIEELCNLIEWANGDTATSKWAKMRAEAGHPAPFNLKYIGIGNEDIISTTFEDRCEMICKAIKERYPDITVCGTAGPFHALSSDYVEGWKFAKQHSDIIDMVDEHYYETVGWLLNNPDYYDDYDRHAPKVYLGEWAAKVGKGGLDCALAEAAYLCNIERNADVVEMTSYAPLLSKNGHSNWSPDMIYFGNTSIQTTPSYETQRLFSVNSGNIYICTRVEGLDSLMRNRVAASVVRDTLSGKTYLKVANVLPRELSLTLSLKNVGLSSQSLNYEGFSGKPGDRTVKTEKGSYPVRQDDKLSIQLPPYSFRVIEL